MKNIALVISSLALVGVIVLFAMQMSGKKNNVNTHTSVTSAGGTSATSGRIAYVDIDTLEANYTYLKNKKEEFAKRQESMKAELERSAQQMQNDIAGIQRKASAGTMTESEYKSAEKRVMQMQQSLQAREASLTKQLMDEQEAFNKELQTRLDQFLEEYNKDKHYDYILSYSRSGSILYADKSLNITNEVIKGMNEMSESKNEAAKGK